MKLIFLLEEQSMKCFLDGLLPRILPAEIDFITIPHEGKSDLQKSLTAKLQGWNEPGVKFVVVQDQDSNDCKQLKEDLKKLCQNAHKEVLIRIACHELEAWYFGDMNALGEAYGVDLSGAKRKSKYRTPDAIMHPKAELKRLLPQHQQIAGARRLAPLIDIQNNSSASFQVFIKGVMDYAESAVFH